MSDSTFHFNSPLGTSAYTSTSPMIPNDIPAVVRQAVVPYKALQEILRQEFITIAKSRQKIIPTVKALYGQWKDGHTPFKKWVDVIADTFGKSSRWAYLFLHEIETELAINVAGEPMSPAEVANTSREQNEKCLSQVEKNRTNTHTSQAAQNLPIVETVNQHSKPPPSKLEKNGAPEPKKNGAPESAPIVDKTGRPIPPYAVEYWKRGTEVQHVLSALSDLRTTIRKANEGGDRLWCAFSTQDMLLSFDALYTSVSNFMPYAVCKKCNGLEAKTLCSMCHGTGLINKITYGFNKS